MNKLVKLDAELDALAEQIKAAFERREHSRDDMAIETMELAVCLLKARDHFKDHISFGRWCDEIQLPIHKDERAALIAFAREPERAKLVLASTKSNSIQMIYRNEFRIRSSTKTTKPKTAKQSPKTDAALAAYDALKAAGVAEPTREQVAEKAGVSEMPARRAITQRKAEAAVIGQEPDLADMPKSWAVKYEAAVRRKVMQLEAEYDRRRMEQVQKHIDEYLMPFYRDKLEKAEQLMQVGKKPFTVDEYRQLLGALHPDSTVESRTKVFIMVKDREHLLRPPERDKPLSSDLPKTIEELLARRKKR